MIRNIVRKQNFLLNKKFSKRFFTNIQEHNFDALVIGAGGAGLRATTGLLEKGFNVACVSKLFPTRSHTVAAQGGINAALGNITEDSWKWHFYDTVKGGDYRSRESNVHRLAEVSTNIIDQCVAQGVPFGRDYGGLLDNRSFGGVLVSRTFYAKGQTGQQLLLGAYSAMNRQIGKGKIINSVKRIIQEEKRSKAGVTAPACGLYLIKVNY